MNMFHSIINFLLCSFNNFASTYKVSLGCSRWNTVISKIPSMRILNSFSLCVGCHKLGVEFIIQILVHVGNGIRDQFF